MAYLYSVPWPMPGMKVSQIPDDWTACMGLASGRQPLKSPTTDTARASGAHTAKCVPATPLRSLRWAPSFS